MAVQPMWARSKKLIVKRWLSGYHRNNLNDLIVGGKEPLVLNSRVHRLFAAGLCRQVYHICNVIGQGLIDCSEEYADDETPETLARWSNWRTNMEPTKIDLYCEGMSPGQRQAATAANHVSNAQPPNIESVAMCALSALAYEFAKFRCDVRILQKLQALLLCSVIGPEWWYNQEWGTTTAVGLAKHIYAERDFAQMPILADALQDAGCESIALLRDLRDLKTPWCRGCRILDVILGKR